MPKQDQQSTRKPQASEKNAGTSKTFHAKPGGQTDSATGEKPGGGGGAPKSKGE